VIIYPVLLPIIDPSPFKIPSFLRSSRCPSQQLKKLLHGGFSRVFLGGKGWEKPWFSLGKPWKTGDFPGKTGDFNDFVGLFWMMIGMIIG
jgi:hypothetical protein